MMPNHKLALITGATSGIGLELARLLAQRGYDLFLASRSAGKMADIQQNFTRQYGVEVHTLEIDLSEPQSASRVFAHCQNKGLEVEVLVNNSGFGLFGPHLANELEPITRLAQLNMVSLVELCTLFAKPMKERRAGYILNVASTAAFQAIPYFAEYAASKAFVLHFSLGLAGELEEHQVTVSCLCPGPTQSQFFAVANPQGAGQSPFGGRPLMTAEEVARAGISTLFAGKLFVIPGWTNKFLAQLNRLFPRRMALNVVKRMFTGEVTGNE
jgi:short-subunit dehydrogenase